MKTSKTRKKNFRLVVIGVSAGGLETLKSLFSKLKENFHLPVVIVQHITPDHDFEFLMEFYSKLSHDLVKEAEEKEKIINNVIYFAPPNYHLLIEDDKTFSLSVEEKVNYSRPSIDVLFTSAADVYFSELLAIILTGANSDGTRGGKIIKDNGGYLIAQDPKEALYPVMPQAAINSGEVDEVLKINNIANFLNNL